MSDIKTGTWLTCGCCGDGFQTWDGYQDQDQDFEYGICKSCQGSITEHNDQQMDQAIAEVRDNLSGNCLGSFNRKDRDAQEVFVMYLINKGALVFKVGKG